MATSKKILIFGNNSSALLSAIAFSKAGHHVDIYDPGQHFQVDSPRYFAPEFSFWPSSEQAFEDLAWLENLLGLSLGGLEVDLPPVTFSGDAVAPFVGFGDKKYSSIPAASVFNRRAHLRINFDERTIYNRLREQCRADIHEFSDISDIRIGADGIESVQINGNKDLSADAYVFCQSPSELIRMAPTDFFASRLLSRLARVHVYSQLTLSVKHPQNFVVPHLLDTQGLLFLLPNQNDQEPVIGQITEHQSVWQAYVSTETAEDAEALATVFRNMRKIVERHIGASSPKFVDELRRASIHMQIETLAEYPTEEAMEIFKKSNNNAILVSPLWSKNHGLSGAVEAVRKATESWTFPETAKALPTSLEATI